MPTATYIALANYTVPSGNATAVTFSSIPATYRDLVLVISGKAVSGESFFYSYFNADTGANYSRVEMTGSGSGSGSSATFSNLIPVTLNSTGESVFMMHIMDYSATDKHKTVLYRNNSVDATAKVLAGAGRWASTNAVNSVKIEGFSTASMAQGVTLSLYGIVS